MRCNPPSCLAKVFESGQVGIGAVVAHPKPTAETRGDGVLVLTPDEVFEVVMEGKRFVGNDFPVARHGVEVWRAGGAEVVVAIGAPDAGMPAGRVPYDLVVGVFLAALEIADVVIRNTVARFVSLEPSRVCDMLAQRLAFLQGAPALVLKVHGVEANSHGHFDVSSSLFFGERVHEPSERRAVEIVAAALTVGMNERAHFHEGCRNYGSVFAREIRLSFNVFLAHAVQVG